MNDDIILDVIHRLDRIEHLLKAVHGLDGPCTPGDYKCQYSADRAARSWRGHACPAHTEIINQNNKTP